MTLESMVAAGQLSTVAPTTDSGTVAYSGGRVFATGGNASLIYSTGLPDGLHLAQTIAFTIIPAFAHDGGGIENLLWCFNDTTSYGEYLVANGWQGYLSNGNGRASSGPVAFAAGSVHHVVFRAAAGATVDLNYDGTDAAQDASSVPSPAAFTALRIGDYYAGGGYAAGGAMSSVIISPSRKSDEWVAALQASDGAAYADPAGLVTDFMAVGDLLLPLAANSTGYKKLYLPFSPPRPSPPSPPVLVRPEETFRISEHIHRYESFPSAVLCDDDTILCAFRDGTGHTSGGTVRLVMWETGAWGNSWLLYDVGPGTEQWQANTLAKRASDGRLFLYCRKYISGAAVNDVTSVWVSYSDDHGANWSDQVQMTDPQDGFDEPSDAFAEHATKFVVATDGHLLTTAMGFRAGESGDYFGIACMESDDGIAWTQRAWIGGGDSVSLNFSENAIVRLGDGRILCVLRCDTDNLLHTSYSSDEGATWTAPASISPDRFGHAPVVRALPDDSLLLSYRGYDATVQVAPSTNYGVTWSPGTVIAQGYNYPDMGYSDMVVDSTGLVHLIYNMDSATAAGQPWLEETTLVLGESPPTMASADAKLNAVATQASVNGLGAPMQADSLVVLTGDYDHAKDDVLTPLEAVQDTADAVALKTNTIGALAVTVTSPVAASGTITLQTGDDYASEDSRAITVAVADLTHALGLDGAVVKLKATQATWEAASVASTTDGYNVTFEATAAQTAAVTRAQHYELEATLANGHVVTLAKGSLLTRTNIPAVV